MRKENRKILSPLLLFLTYSMKHIYITSQISKLSLTLYTFGITDSVAGLFLT